MVGLHPVRLPLAWSARARRERQWNVSVISRASGVEHRLLTTQSPLSAYTIDACEVKTTEAEALAAFLDARAGALHAFLLRDQLDFKSGGITVAISPSDQQIGVGDGAKKRFALTKSYADAAGAWARRIWHPIAESVVVAVAGSPLAASAFTVAENGFVDLIAAPSAGAVVTAGFRFDVRVRLDGEAPTFAAVNDDVCAVSAFRLKEVCAP